MNENHFQNEIASHIGKMLREAFGKGPQSIFVSMEPPFFVVYLRNFLTPTEKILLKQGQVRTIQHTRDLVMRSLIPEIKAYLLLLTGMNLSEFYYDWELHNHSGIFVGLQSEDVSWTSEADKQYEGEEELHREIRAISHRVQKQPEQLFSRMINKRTLLVVRTGNLIDLSKELIRLRDEEHLKQALNELEKKYLRDNKYVEQILGAKIVDVFVDWNFHVDRSVIVLIVRPKV
ncbi:Na-translocating system protein MpsC family protein [Paenibacillus koleovorans]|uniref:Na-translocating system protein MpsC family protein n=1 Tax=Paenibacillus koleovorans TaxID=121608 RepID=UPI000FDA785E|nr:Na-translocating system protein MpsC family protein [Paenibacillus koleovorans]